MTFGKNDFSEETGSEGCQVGGGVLKASVILRSKELEAVSIGSFEEQNKTKQNSHVAYLGAGRVEPYLVSCQILFKMTA